jgi:intraflagellar transport protein 80
VWSRKGESRSSLAQAGAPVYALAWAADSEQVLFSSGGELVVRSLQSSSRESRWRAHDAPVLALDWSPVSGLIVSGAEDCKYKVGAGNGGKGGGEEGCLQGLEARRRAVGGLLMDG